MGVKVISRKYKNQFHNSSEQTDWLLGNVCDFQRLEVDFEVTIDFYATAQESVTVDELQNTFKLNNGNGWQDYGFDIGDSVVFSYTILTIDNDQNISEVPVVLNFNIVNIYNDVMEVDIELDFEQYDILPTDRGNIKIKDVRFLTLKEPEGIKFKYTHLSNENNESDSLNSFIDGSITEFSFAGLQDLIPNLNQDMSPDSIQSGMAIDRVQVMKLPDNVDETQQLSLETNQVFRLVTYKFPYSDNYVNWNQQAHSIAMILNTTGNEMQNSIGDFIPMNLYNGGSYIDGSEPTLFIDQSQTGGVRYYNANINFRIINTNDNSNSDQVRLVAIRYKNNSAYNFSQKIVLKEWNNASSLTGISLHYNEVMVLPIDEGDSYVLAIEYYHQAQPTERWVDVVIDNGYINVAGGNASNVYRVTVDYMLASLFEQPSNLEDLVAPSILFNAGSLTDNFKIDIFPEWNNPNTSISNNLDHTERLGNTGWFNENFNGLDNNFIVESLKYLDDDGNEVTQLDFGAPINVEVEVSGIENLSGNSEFGLGFAWIPQNEEDYYNKTTPFHQNLFINTGRKYTDGVNDSFNLGESTGNQIFEGNSFSDVKMNIQATNDVLFNPVSEGRVIMKVRFIPTPSFTSFFENRSENDRKYAIWVSVANHDLQINFSDRVTLLLDYNDMVKTIPEVGSYTGMTCRFIEHPQNELVTGTNLYRGFVEDDVLARIGFYVNSNDNDFINKMTFGYEIENLVTGLTYTLEEIVINLTQFPINNGAQQINFEGSRGFKLKSGNNKNWVKLFRHTEFDDNNNKFYRGYFATKIRWEDWLQRNNVPTEFFNNLLENNGYNNDWIDYLRNGGDNSYKFNFFVKTEIERNGDVRVHKNDFEITFADYDENLNIETTHQYFRHSDDTLLNVGTDPETGTPLGVLLSNEPTRIEITYTNLTSDFDIEKMYATITMEIYKGAGEMEHRQLSSVWESENDNFLIPLPTETKLKFVQLETNIVKTICLVDNNKLQDALKYKVSGRIGCFPEGIGNNTINKKYEARYSDKYE